MKRELVIAFFAFASAAFAQYYLYAWDVDSLICVGLNADYGYFGVELGDGRWLTYGGATCGGMGTMHIHFFVDSAIHSTDVWPPPPAIQIFPDTSFYYDLNNSIITKWFPILELEFRQTLRPFSVDSAGAIMIGYDVSNSDTMAHQIGVLLQMDTNIDGMDDAPFYIPDYDIWVDSTLVLHGSDVPSSLEITGYSSSETTCAILNLGGEFCTKPDWLVIGCLRTLIGVVWDVASIPDESIDDGAMILIWGPVELAAGTGTTFVVSYGTTIEPDYVSKKQAIPREASLVAYPNPFNSSCAIQVSGIGNRESVALEIYDLRGKRICTGNLGARHSTAKMQLDEALSENGSLLQTGAQTFIWSPDKSIASGIYIVKGTFDDNLFVQKKVIFLR